MKPILEKLGGIPLTEKQAKISSLKWSKNSKVSDTFNLVIAPEATRAKDGSERKPIRTGFWHIAKAANVQLYWCMQMHEPKKAVF